VTADQFKAGLAIIQAMPGPMFNFSAYALLAAALLASVCLCLRCPQLQPLLPVPCYCRASPQSLQD
jgi:hypothetical protein